MKLNSFISSLKEAINDLPEDTLDAIITYATDANRDIQSRVIETGRNDKGVSLQTIKDYSESYKRKKAGLTSKKIKNANKKLARDLEAGRELSPTTLNKSIAISGRYKGFVDLNNTTRMWNNIQPKVELAEVSETQVKVSVGPLDEENRKKLEGNVIGNGKWSGRGQVLMLSDSEMIPLNKNFGDTIVEKFRAHFT